MAKAKAVTRKAGKATATKGKADPVKATKATATKGKGKAAAVTAAAPERKATKGNGNGSAAAVTWLDAEQRCAASYDGKAVTLQIVIPVDAASLHHWPRTQSGKAQIHQVTAGWQTLATVGGLELRLPPLNVLAQPPYNGGRRS